MEDVLRFLNKTVKYKDKFIILGCSAGPDSMCLFDILYKNDYKIVCACVNHNLREESREEYSYLETYCQNCGIVFEGLELPKGLNESEAFYRKKRYDFYKYLADKYRTSYIATAHHGDDLIETVLMRITRGSNLKGYSGFAKVYEEGHYTFLKPLIFYTKAEILDYNMKNGVIFYHDRTNDEDTYTRNRYRHFVLPFLKGENGDVHKKYVQFSEELNMANTCLVNIAKKEIKKNYSSKCLDLKQFLTLDTYLRRLELELIVSELYGDDIGDIEKKHIDNLLKLLTKDKNFSLSFPKMTIRREYDRLYFSTLEKSGDYFLELKSHNVLKNGDIIDMITECNDYSNYTTRLDSSKFALPLYIRSRKPGDKMEIKNLGGSQKVKKIMIDEKVSPSERNTWPLIVDSHDMIVWLPGLKKSKFDNDKNEKYDIILTYERKGFKYEE